MNPTAELDDAPTEIDSPSEGGNLDHVASLEDDTDMYGFLSREQELEQQRLRHRSRSRSPLRHEVLEWTREMLARQAASIPPGTSSDCTSIVAEMNRQTVFLNILPPRMMERASITNSTMYYQFLYSGMDKLQKIALHLRGKYPGRAWGAYLQEVSSFGKFCNTVEEMKQNMYTCNSSYKWGATGDLVRRWWDLGLHKSYSHLYYVVTESLADSSGLEKNLIRVAKSDKTPELIRLRCENNTIGGEGLGQDHDYRPTVQGHFVCLAIASNR